MTTLPTQPAAAAQPCLRPRMALMAAIALTLAACVMPPPRVKQPSLRDDVPLAGLQTTARAGWPEAQWWKTYDDPQLDELVDLAMRQAPDLAIASSRIRAAEASVRAAAAQMGLSIDGSAQVARHRLSEHGLIPARFLGFTWYNQADLGAELRYSFDWWGKQRAAVEAALDQAHAAEAQRSAAALAIQYAVADTYFGWQADRARLTIADQSLAVQRELSKIADLRVRQGVDLPDEAQRARARLASVRELRAAIDSSARIRLSALASLLGVARSQLPPMEPRPLPPVGGGLPGNASVDLIARRPDIAASRWQVESALRQTDVARAQFLPDLSISAMAGLSSIDLGKLFSASSRTFSLAPALHLPLFNSGLLKANYGFSQAQLKSAVAQYDATVLAAAREVSTQALTADLLATRRDEQKTQIDADQHLLRNAQARRHQGVRDARESLAAKAQLLMQRDAATQLHAQALSTDLALIKALGGGYRMPPQTHTASTSASPSSSANAGAHP